MKLRTISVLAFALLFLGASLSYGQASKAGLNAAAFLKVGVGARMVALGSAVTTLEGDANQMFWNPAGIDMEEGKTQIVFTHNQWIADLSHMAGGVTHNLAGIGTIGVGFIRLGLGDISADRDIAPAGLERYQIDSQTTDTYDFQDLALQLTYSRRFTDRFVFGATAKYISETIDEEKADAFALDFGIVYRTGFRDLAVGARLNNLGSDIKYYDIEAPIPLNFSIGASMTLAEEENSSFRIFADATKPQDQRQLLFGGAEYKLGEIASIRGGYKFNYSGVKDDFGRKYTDEGFSFGGGLDLPYSNYHLRLDYAFTDFGLFDNVHRFSLGFEF